MDSTSNPPHLVIPEMGLDDMSSTALNKGASRSGSLLGLLHRRERDSRIFTNAEIIFDDFRSKDPLPLANRGNTFVSLSGFLEILSKTELSSDKIDDFQEEIFGRVINESLITQQTFSKNTPNVVLISESGLYRILAKCNLPKCEPFESWVFDEVLARRRGNCIVRHFVLCDSDLT